MASSLLKLTTINNLAPGQSTTHHWNNAIPGWAVWYIQAVPLESSFTGADLPEQSVEVETTKVWRKLIRTKTTGDVQTHKFEYEIWYTIKNVGAKKVDVDVYASVIS